MHRRELLMTGAAMPLLLALAPVPRRRMMRRRPRRSTDDTVPAMAQQLAAKPFKPADSTLPPN